MIKTLNSGSTLEVTMSSFSISYKLFKVVMKEIAQVNIVLGIKGKTLKEVIGMDVGDEAINTLKNILASIVSSDEVEAVLWECMGRATYNKMKITRELFNDESPRGDYLEIAKEVMIFNLTPFFKSLNSLLSDLPIRKNIDTQKLT